MATNQQQQPAPQPHPTTRTRTNPAKNLLNEQNYTTQEEQLQQQRRDSFSKPRDPLNVAQIARVRSFQLEAPVISLPPLSVPSVTISPASCVDPELVYPPAASSSPVCIVPNPSKEAEANRAHANMETTGRPTLVRELEHENVENKTDGKTTEKEVEATSSSSSASGATCSETSSVTTDEEQDICRQDNDNDKRKGRFSAGYHRLTDEKTSGSVNAGEGEVQDCQTKKYTTPTTTTQQQMPITIVASCPAASPLVQMIENSRSHNIKNVALVETSKPQSSLFHHRTRRKSGGTNLSMATTAASSNSVSRRNSPRQKQMLKKNFYQEHDYGPRAGGVVARGRAGLAGAERHDQRHKNKALVCSSSSSNVASSSSTPMPQESSEETVSVRHRSTRRRELMRGGRPRIFSHNSSTLSSRNKETTTEREDMLSSSVVSTSSSADSSRRQQNVEGHRPNYTTSTRIMKTDKKDELQHPPSSSASSSSSDNSTSSDNSSSGSSSSQEESNVPPGNNLQRNTAIGPTREQAKKPLFHHHSKPKPKPDPGSCSSCISSSSQQRPNIPASSTTPAARGGQRLVPSTSLKDLQIVRSEKRSSRPQAFEQDTSEEHSKSETRSCLQSVVQSSVHASAFSSCSDDYSIYLLPSSCSGSVAMPHTPSEVAVIPPPVAPFATDTNIRVPAPRGAPPPSPQQGSPTARNGSFSLPPTTRVSEIVLQVDNGDEAGGEKARVEKLKAFYEANASRKKCVRIAIPSTTTMADAQSEHLLSSPEDTRASKNPALAKKNRDDNEMRKPLLHQEERPGGAPALFRRSATICSSTTSSCSSTCASSSTTSLAHRMVFVPERNKVLFVTSKPPYDGPKRGIRRPLDLEPRRPIRGLRNLCMGSLSSFFPGAFRGSRASSAATSKESSACATRATSPSGRTKQNEEHQQQMTNTDSATRRSSSTAKDKPIDVKVEHVVHGQQQHQEPLQVHESIVEFEPWQSLDIEFGDPATSGNRCRAWIRMPALAVNDVANQTFSVPLHFGPDPPGDV
ncbi:unnamed protein product [Amoebophrya sp. A25]|nr:unnamed protein product [Amoebophrya sp. A25]|eukprot:GSA25T00007269001.1